MRSGRSRGRCACGGGVVAGGRPSGPGARTVRRAGLPGPRRHHRGGRRGGAGDVEALTEMGVAAVFGPGTVIAAADLLNRLP